MKKFELTNEFITNMFGTKLFRIRALVEFGDVEAGELGGYVEKESNLGHDDDAWVYDNAWVYGDAQVSGDALVCGDARVCGNGDYAYAHGFGSVNRTTTFFRLKDGGVGVRCGCFYGTLAQFRDKIRETHGESAIAEEYLDLAALMEKRFRRTGTEDRRRKLRRMFITQN